MILVIDNYDSFVYNLVQYLGELGEKKVEIFRNDKISLSRIKTLEPKRIVISPGPGRPENAGICNGIIKKFVGKIPILGDCLGHQCIGYSLGAKIVSAKKLMHGKISLIYHNGKGIYRGLKNPFEATRYHSLIIEEESVPDVLKITARTISGEIMGIEHKKFPLYGVQFHPESILTKEGKKLLSNFLRM